MTLGIQDIVEVRAQITPRGAGGREFGRTLLLTTDPTMDVGAGRVGVFASMDEVARVFTADSVPYQAAQVYFSQVPYPRNLVIGRWINTRESARLTGGSPRALEQITGSPTVVRGSGTVASLDTFHGRATVLTGAGMVADLVNFHGRATVLTGTGMVADLVNFHGRATVLTGTGTVADLVNFHGRATVLTGTGTVADLVNFHGRATVLTGTGTVADLVNFHGRATVLTGTGTVASLTTLQGITSGTVTFLGQTLTGLDFSAVTDLDGVASTLQSALRATSATDLDNVEVDYDSAASAFVVTLPLDSSTGVVPTASAAFTGAESDELGLDTATIVNGVDAIVSGTVTFLGQTVTGLDFSSVTDYDGVASVLQTALRATSATILDEVEVAYQGGVFVVIIPLDSQGAATRVSAAFTGDDADELGLDTATIVNGVDAIVSGSVTFLSQTVTGLDFSAVTDLDDVAAVLQTALRGATGTTLDAVEVAYDSDASAFVVTIPLAADGSATAVTAAFTGATADELGLDTVTIEDGIDTITAGSVTFHGASLTGLDFSSVAGYDDVAAVVQNALRGSSVATLDAVEVEHDGSQFVLTLPLGLDGSATEVSGPFTGEHADELGLGTVEITAGVDGIGAGSLTWQGYTISGLDFTGAASYDDVANIVQTALRAVTASGRADLRSASVEYDPADFFRASLGFRTNGDPYPINGFKVDVAQGAASALGLDNASGGSIDPGHASETIEGAMDAISGLDDGWYFVTVDSSITTGADLLSLSRWVQAKVHMLALDVVDEGVLTPNESTSLAAQLSALEQQRTFLV